MQNNSKETSSPERKLKKGWIESYIDWARPRTDAPTSFTAWGAMFALAAAVERKIQVPRKYLGSWECEPYLYIMLVGDPGVRKTTSMRQAEQLLQQVPTLFKGPNLFTKEYLIQLLINTPRSAVYITVGEFADLLQKNKVEIYDTLTSLYDGAKELSEGTRSRATEVAIKPCLNMFAATTPSWINRNMDSSVTGGGFASRCIWVYADRSDMGKPKLLYDRDVNEKEFEALEAELVHDLEIIANLQGEMLLTRGRETNESDPRTAPYGDEDSGEWIEAFITKMKPDTSDINLLNYYSRKSLQIVKLAILHSVSERNDMVVTVADFKFAISVLEKTEKKLHKVFGGMGRNIYQEDTSRMMEFIVKHMAETGTPVERAVIFQKYESAATPDVLERLIYGKVVANQILPIDKGGTIYYAPHPKYLEQLGSLT